MFCSNCGAKVDENAVVCVKCGAAVKKDGNIANNMQMKPAGSGAATASMVLGILAIIFGVITFFIAAGMATYASKSLEVQLYGTFSDSYQAEKMGMAIGVVFLPGILSIIGFFLAIGSRGKIKNGANGAGLALNLITIILCVIQFMMIMGM